MSTYTVYTTVYVTFLCLTQSKPALLTNVNIIPCFEPLAQIEEELTEILYLKSSRGFSVSSPGGGCAAEKNRGRRQGG